MKSYHPRICRECGTEFKPNSGRQIYCTTECRFGQTDCAGCGTRFQRTAAVGRHQRFCSPRCARETRAQAERGPCPVCGGRVIAGRKRYCSVDCKVEASRRRKAQVICEEPTCRKLFAAKASLKRRFCSRSCALRSRPSRLTQVHPVGARQESKNGYILVKQEDGTWIPEHWIVMGDSLGRPVTGRERVHHKNGRRADNRLENLELWTLDHKDPAGVRLSDVAHCPTCTCSVVAVE